MAAVTLLTTDVIHASGAVRSAMFSVRCTKVRICKIWAPLIGASLFLLYETAVVRLKGPAPPVPQEQLISASAEMSGQGPDDAAHLPTTSEPAPSSQRPPRVALYWTSLYDREDFGLGLGRTPFEGCPVSNCEATSNRSLLSVADGVFFHGRSMNDTDLPRRRRPEQKFIFAVQESPIFTYLNWTGLDGFFNLSMTYKRDADIYYPYGETVQGRQEGKVPEFSQRKLVAAWVVSHCDTHSEREKYVDELEKYLPIIKLGKCGRQLCNGTVAECYRRLAADNLFYLAFENSLCTDYITEKLWLALRVGMIPVVRGPPPGTYHRVAPPHSFVHVQRFAGPAALASYLHKLAQNRTAFDEYHAWRDTWRVQRRRAACDVCAELWKSPGGSRQLKISDVWSCKKNCHRAKDVRVDHIVDRLFILKNKLVHRRLKELEAAVIRSRLLS